MTFIKILQDFKHVNYTHIFYDQNNKPYMYFLNWENDKNILYFTDGIEVKKVSLMSLSIITQVFAYKNFKNNTYCVSLCIKNTTGNSLYFIETSDPLDFKIMDSITTDCKSGIITPRYAFIVTLSNYIFMYKRNMINKTPGNILDNLSKQAFFSNKNILHVSSISKDETKILISYDDQQTKEYGSLIVDLNNSDEQYTILSDTNNPIFEPTVDIINNQILFKNEWNLFNCISLDKINKNKTQIIQKK